MRGYAANGFVIVKVVTEFGHIGIVLVFAVSQFALQQSFVPQPGSQVLYQHWVFRPALTEQIPHTVQYGLNR